MKNYWLRHHAIKERWLPPTEDEWYHCHSHCVLNWDFLLGDTCKEKIEQISQFLYGLEAGGDVIDHIYTSEDMGELFKNLAYQAKDDVIQCGIFTIIADPAFNIRGYMVIHYKGIRDMTTVLIQNMPTME